MAEGGWFAVKRGITRHPLFKGHPERIAIWLWLVDNAAWKDTPHDIRGELVTVRRGSVAVSERRLAEEVGVGYQVVRTFLARLKGEHMINASITHGRNVITLCNYDKYQSFENAPNAEGNATLTHDQRIKEQGNNYSDTIVSGRADFSDGDVDPEKLMFDAGVALLGAAGVGERQARSIVAKWRKSAGTESVIAAIGRAKREGAVEPVSFIEGCLKHAKRSVEGRVAGGALL